jgi:hypothetical protein
MSAICSPPKFPLRRIMRCPTCAQRRRFAGYDQAWYGPTWTCCGCGDSWGDGERLERPFRRGWRPDAIQRAKRIWDGAGAFTRRDWHAWLIEQIEPT